MAICPECHMDKPLASPRCPNCNQDIGFINTLIAQMVYLGTVIVGTVIMLWFFRFLYLAFIA